MSCVSGDGRGYFVSNLLDKLLGWCVHAVQRRRQTSSDGCICLIDSAQILSGRSSLPQQSFSRHEIPLRPQDDVIDSKERLGVFDKAEMHDLICSCPRRATLW